MSRRRVHIFDVPISAIPPYSIGISPVISLLETSKVSIIESIISCWILGDFVLCPVHLKGANKTYASGSKIPVRMVKFRVENFFQWLESLQVGRLDVEAYSGI
jgi:hypothetical protein